jgi:hypothetical protein
MDARGVGIEMGGAVGTTGSELGMEAIGGELGMEAIGGELGMEAIGGELGMEATGGELGMEAIGGEVGMEAIGGELGMEAIGGELGMETGAPASASAPKRLKPRRSCPAMGAEYAGRVTARITKVKKGIDVRILR